MVRVIDILIESEAWLSRTGGIGGFSGSDIVLSGPTEGQDWDEQYQQVATYSHSSTRKQDTGRVYTACSWYNKKTIDSGQKLTSLLYVGYMQS